MSFLKNLFSKKQQQVQPVPDGVKNPDNTKLLYLLDTFSNHQSEDNHRAVMDEIMTGNAYLLVSSINDDSIHSGWQTADEGETINFSCVLDVDGLKVLAAFTDEVALIEWAKRPTQYTALPATNVIDFCQQNNVDRIVINSDQKNMFVMERDRSHITTTTVEEPTQVMIGALASPLPTEVIDKLKANFSRVDSINEAYQFWQQMGNETSIVLGIRMSYTAENSRIALQNAISNALINVTLEMPLDVMQLNDEWLLSVQDIPGSLFYKR